VSRKRQIFWLSTAALLAIIVVWVAREYARVQRIPGIYLIDGGLGYVEIAHDWADGWRITRSKAALETLWCFAPKASRVSSVWPRLVLMGKLSWAGGPRGGPAYLVPFDYHDVAVFTRSRSRTDDWDLTECGVASSSSQAPQPRNGWIGRLLDKWWPLAKAPGVIPLQPRVPYLHRLNDDRVVDCFNLHYRDKDSTGALEKASELLRSYPNDPYVRTLYLIFAARNGQIEEVAKRLEQWQNDADRPNDPYLRLAHKCLGLWVSASCLTGAGRNGYDFLWTVYSRDLDLPTHLNLLPHALDFDEYLNTTILEDFNGTQNPFLLPQVMAKVVQVVAMFRMLEGKWNESLRLLASVCHAGNLMMRDTTPIGSLVGAAIMAIGSRGLALYALNCCETEQDFRQLWAILDRLEQGQKPVSPEDVLSFRSPVQQLELSFPRETTGVTSLAYVVTAGNAWRVHLDLVRLATAAKYHLLATGRFPVNDGDFGPLLPSGPPKDLFSEQPLRFVSGNGMFVGYSVGPDRYDDVAGMEYDPTNGTLSRGDIFLRVPRVREYPFPREGVRATDIPDLLRQFPNGLPPDPFASTRGKGLGTTMTAAGDVYVFSYGPDVDEFKTLPASARVPLCHYDPTNGTVSAGDLFIRLPRP